ncbi:RNA polymerase sigma factor [Peristeroidobacter soli]|jgi:RNA polymerase sigma factor (sigma-70 family)|uniref:RNA polymerase sigma factor n=1 Tax=Peristeroidobacter soli TaxID=2497877 RepID=UPI00101BD23F|nr:RNA polymerase sigma factor [Peristeroidobacter soli]
MRDITIIPPGQTTRAFNEYRREVRDFLRGLLKCSHTADDLTQETYLRVARLDETTDVKNWRALILRIARNLAIDHLRGRERRFEVEQEMDALYDVTDEAPGAGETLANEESLRLLESTLLELPPVPRRVLELYRQHGYSHPEIARELGLSVRTVARHMAFAVSYLRERMHR